MPVPVQPLHPRTISRPTIGRVTLQRFGRLIDLMLIVSDRMLPYTSDLFSCCQNLDCFIKKVPKELQLQMWTKVMMSFMCSFIPPSSTSFYCITVHHATIKTTLQNMCTSLHPCVHIFLPINTSTTLIQKQILIAQPGFQQQVTHIWHHHPPLPPQHILPLYHQMLRYVLSASSVKQPTFLSGNECANITT